MSAGRRVEIRAQKRLFDDFFKIDELIVRHQRYDGSMSGEERRLVFERGDAVAVLLFDAQARTAVLVEQFRPPTLIARRRDDRASTAGWIIELVAGMIDEGETAEQAAIRVRGDRLSDSRSEADRQILFIAGRLGRAVLSLLRACGKDTT
jgi:nudix-type nucleoside diphosphatase (YffH/AdpP family)